MLKLLEWFLFHSECFNVEGGETEIDAHGDLSFDPIMEAKTQALFYYCSRRDSDFEFWVSYPCNTAQV